jgi:hypothetical protein
MGVGSTAEAVVGGMVASAGDGDGEAAGALGGLVDTGCPLHPQTSGAAATRNMRTRASTGKP